MARNYFRHGMHFFNPELDSYGRPQRAGTEFPIYSYLLAMLYKVFGLHEVLGRLLSMALTAWSAVFLYEFVKPRLGELAAFWSALVMCSIPVHIYFTRTVQPEPMALWGFLGFLTYMDRWRQSSNAGELLAAVLLGAIGPLLKLPFLYLVLGLWGVMALEDRGLLRKAAFWGIPGFIVLVTGAWYHYAKSAPDQTLPLGAADQWRNLSDTFHWAYWQDQMISRFPELCTTYSGLLLGIIGVFSLSRHSGLRRGDVHWFFFGWWGVTLVYTGLLGEYGHIHRYTLLPWAPVNAIFIAAGIMAFRDFAHSRRHWKCFLAVLIIGIPVHAALRIKHWYRVERTYLFRAQPIVAAHTGPNDLLLTNTRETPVLLYYLDRYGFTVDLDHASPAEVDALLRQGPKLFITPVEGSWTRHPEWADFFAQRGRLLQQDPEYLLYELI